jgi:hypothetical protein
MTQITQVVQAGRTVLQWGAGDGTTPRVALRSLPVHVPTTVLLPPAPTSAARKLAPTSLDGKLGSRV